MIDNLNRTFANIEVLRQLIRRGLLSLFYFQSSFVGQEAALTDLSLPADVMNVDEIDLSSLLNGCSMAAEHDSVRPTIVLHIFILPSRR